MSVKMYKCPNCGASLSFDGKGQSWKCEFCLGEFDKSQVLEQDVSESASAPDDSAFGNFSWSDQNEEEVIEQSKVDDKKQSEFEKEVETYSCSSCGAQIVTDANTAATFCSFCGGPTIIKQRLDGLYRPAVVIPFKTSKKDAEATFKKFMKRKPLLPNQFKQNAKADKITGMYVPFWLYDCDAHGGVHAKAQKIMTWSDSKYHYTKTDHYNVIREGTAKFNKVPADASVKMDNKIMDLLEPYEYDGLTEFDMAYLSGFFAEKYDEDEHAVFPRVKEKVSKSLESLLCETIHGFTSYTVMNRSCNIPKNTAEYALLPVWMMTVKYKEKVLIYTINGQTGRIIGKLPVSVFKAALWFVGIAAVAFLLMLGGGALIL